MRSAAFIFLTISLAIPWQRAEAIGEISGGSMKISRWAGNAQGQVSSGSNFSLNTSIGEAAFSTAAAGKYSVNPGYMKLAAQPGSVVAITAVSKSTGTLKLSWQAPGADGFLGRVINGYYRIALSSSPALADAFGPTAFTLPEISTSVVPNTPQQYTLTGLAPNTTYYAKIYLGDTGKVIADRSALSAEATLADLPFNPHITAISACNATISWTVPSSGAEGYSSNASSTNFGVLYPGGDLQTSATPDGTQVSLKISGLTPATVYYFRVASLNWQGDKNFITLSAAVTPAGACLAPLSGLTAAGNPYSPRTINLAWVNGSAEQVGVVVMLSTSPVAPVITDGTNLTPGNKGSYIVKSTAAADSLLDTTGLTSSLALDTTYFYHLMAEYAGPMYSVAVSTSVFLDLPPMAPSGLTAAMNSAHTQVTLNWKKVESSLDGTTFHSATPMNEELSHYLVQRSSTVGAPHWVDIATLPVTAESYLSAVAAGDPAYIYRISAMDSLGKTDSAMGVDTAQGIYIFSPTQVAKLSIPVALSQELLAANNKYASDILIRAVSEPSDAANGIYNAVRFEAVRTPGNEPLPDFKFSRPELSIAMSYALDGSGDVTSPSAAPSISAGDAAQRLGLFWNNGERYVQLFGAVDTLNRLVSVQTAMTGQYQVRATTRDSGVHFAIAGLSNRAITPNGDGRNDTAVFTFDNPRNAAFSGKIYDMNGAFVANMVSGPVPASSLQWDGKAGGRPVQGGAYVYQIKAEDKTFNGTLLVVR